MTSLFLHMHFKNNLAYIFYGIDLVTTRHVLYLVKSYMSGQNSQCEPSRFYAIHVQSVLQIIGMKFCIPAKSPHTKITSLHHPIVKTPTMGRYVHSTMKERSVSLSVCSYMTLTSHLLSFHPSMVGCCMVSDRKRLWKLLSMISVDGNGPHALLLLYLAPCCLPGHHQQW
jgi:hypothetical protein